MAGAVGVAVFDATVATLVALVALAVAAVAFATIAASVGASQQLAGGASPATAAVADTFLADTAASTVLQTALL